MDCVEYIERSIVKKAVEDGKYPYGIEIPMEYYAELRIKGLLVTLNSHLGGTDLSAYGDVIVTPLKSLGRNCSP